MRLQEIAHGVVLDMYVKPNSKEFRLELDEDELVVFCRESPVNGKVNKELLKKFSRLFGRKMELVSGFTSRQKKFLIINIEAKEVNRILASASNTQ